MFHIRVTAIILTFLLNLCAAVPVATSSHHNSTANTIAKKRFGCHNRHIIQYLKQRVKSSIAMSENNTGDSASLRERLENGVNAVISSHATYFFLMALVCVLMGVLVFKEMLIRRRRRRRRAAMLLEKRMVVARKEGGSKKAAAEGAAEFSEKVIV